jgi:ABC-type branched-subunit amino acid transport system substrate-binding protein
LTRKLPAPHTRNRSKVERRVRRLRGVASFCRLLSLDWKFMSVFRVAALFVLASLLSCSSNFSVRPCKADADCGAGLVCSESATCVSLASLPPLRLGMSAPVSGTNSELGIEMKRGLTAALNELNAQGGIRSRKVELEFLDDGYQPALAETSVRKLLDVQSQPGVPPRCPTTTTPPVAGQMAFSDSALTRGPAAVLAVVGNVGTPTMVRSAPIAVETSTIFFGPFTGSATMLRDGKAGACSKYLFNVRASYAEEARATLEYFLARGVKDWQHLVSFDQSDAFGQQGFDGLTKAYADLSAAKMTLPAADPNTPIARFRYTRVSPSCGQGFPTAYTA